MQGGYITVEAEVEKAQLSLYFFLKDNETAVCLFGLPFFEKNLEKKNFEDISATFES